jgi:beta-phosphoglucomutase family hydrolase
MGEKGVIWDLDGVLVDTGELHYLSWRAVLPEYKIDFTREVFQTTFGMNNTGVLSTFLGYTPDPELVDEISARKEQWFREQARGHAPALPGVRTWLERLRAAGYRQAIASSAPPQNIDALIDNVDLRGYFDAIVSGFDLPGKPDPTTFLKAAEAIAVRPQRCVVVEDATAGVQGAMRAGMRCIAVTTTNPPEALQGADLIVEHLDALPADTFDRLLGLGPA